MAHVGGGGRINQRPCERSTELHSKNTFDTGGGFE